MPRVRTAAAFALIAASCHLADDPEPPKCGPEEHPELGRCVLNDSALHVVRIAREGGADCAIGPDPLHVKANEDFQFANDDTVAHVVKGADGQTWASVAPGKSSEFTAIAKIGSWAYTVSDCGRGGTVVVE